MISEVINVLRTKKFKANSEAMAIAKGSNQIALTLPKVWKQAWLKRNIKKWQRK